LAQIQALLLDFEGQKPGEYLLDVADRVLQHEIEADAGTIAAAQELNKIDFGKYPAPHLVGSPDLQDLMQRMIYVHIHRLELSEGEGKIQLQFGDVMHWKDVDTAEFGKDVSIIVTPACDLARDGVKCVLLLSGKLENLQPKDWSYKSTPVRTAIVILPDSGRHWIKWNFKDIKTLKSSELEALLAESSKLKRIGRLREIYAIEIQQKLLADMGRIGRPANLPVSFPISVSLYYADTDGKAKGLDITEIESAVCFVGRDADSKSVYRLVLTEQICGRIEQALRKLSGDMVHSQARASLAAVQENQDFFVRLERGEIEIPENTGVKENKSIDNNVYAVVMRDDALDEGGDVAPKLRKAALIIKVIDTPVDEVD
jgi:hypothetical protein